MPLTGEAIQAAGRDGAERAKRWLEATCRAEVKWNNPNIGVNKLQFRKAGADPGSNAGGDYFSFDLGGTLMGGAEDGQMFVAEVKGVRAAGEQGSEYQSFLAKSYRTEIVVPQMYEHYMWITWAPFLVSAWAKLLTPAFVLAAIQKGAESIHIALGAEDPSSTIAETVASKVLIVVLSERQEKLLTLHGNELLNVRKALLGIRAGAT